MTQRTCANTQSVATTRTSSSSAITLATVAPSLTTIQPSMDPCNLVQGDAGPDRCVGPVRLTLYAAW
ncbi:MAG: hypothetical protein QF561_04715 [Phycisphaerales bacterium]|nr:hypothetical protein [Phycisphaerales bacterium]